jgi:hypothetical protein
VIRLQWPSLSATASYTDKGDREPLPDIHEPLQEQSSANYVRRQSRRARLNLCIKNIHAELFKRGFKARLEKADEYFYFWTGEAEDWLDRTVRVLHALAFVNGHIAVSYPRGLCSTMAKYLKHHETQSQKRVRP